MGFSGLEWGMSRHPVREEMVGIARLYDMTALDWWVQQGEHHEGALIHKLLADNWAVEESHYSPEKGMSRTCSSYILAWSQNCFNKNEKVCVFPASFSIKK